MLFGTAGKTFGGVGGVGVGVGGGGDLNSSKNFYPNILNATEESPTISNSDKWLVSRSFGDYFAVSPNKLMKR